MNKTIEIEMQKSNKEILEKLQSFQNDGGWWIEELANRATTIPEINKELYFVILCHLEPNGALKFNTVIKRVHLALNNIIKQSVDDNNLNQEAIKYKDELIEFEETLPKQYLHSQIPIMLRHQKIIGRFSLQAAQLINKLRSIQG